LKIIIPELCFRECRVALDPLPIHKFRKWLIFRTAPNRYNPIGSLSVLFSAEIPSKIENQKDEQDEAKATSSDQGAAKVKTAATEQEH